jgi:hypothetical protein
MTQIGKTYGYYHFLMSLVGGDLTRFKQHIYYPVEEILYYAQYSSDLNQVRNVKQL